MTRRFLLLAALLAPLFPRRSPARLARAMYRSNLIRKKLALDWERVLAMATDKDREIAASIRVL
jgi:hypothetical protein